jgi:DNA invertase Pin-like site-specific DNA recombinase
MTIHAYLRTSTDDQQYGIEAQRTAIAARFPTVVEHVEHASGKNLKGRPVFSALVESLGAGDTLVVAKLDRFARSVEDAVSVAKRLMDKGVGLVVLDLDMDFSTPIGKLVFSVLASVAEFERNMISSRTRDGLAAAKAQGVTLGRRSNIDCDLVTALHIKGMSIRQIVEETGYSRSAVQRCLVRSSA